MQHAALPAVKINSHRDSYYTKLIEVYLRGSGPTAAQVLDIGWFVALPSVHKHMVDLSDSGLPFQIKLKMVRLIDIPGKGEFGRLHGVNMVPFRVVPGVCCRTLPESLEGISSILRSNIKEKIDNYTQLETSD